MAGRLFYTEAEKICLQELIFKYKLYSNRTHQAGNTAAKKLAWTRLVEEFNNISSNSKRTEAQLKKLWDNLKTRHKASFCREKREAMKTGGGVFGESEPNSQVLIEDPLIDQVDVKVECDINTDYITGEINAHTPLYQQSEGTHNDGENSSDSNDMCRSSKRLAAQQQFESGSSQASGKVRHSTGQPSVQGQSEYQSGQALGARNVRARVINKEFQLREKHYALQIKHGEALHKLKIKEQQIINEREEVLLEKAKLELKLVQETLRVTLIKNRLLMETN